MNRGRTSSRSHRAPGAYARGSLATVKQCFTLGAPPIDAARQCTMLRPLMRFLPLVLAASFAAGCAPAIGDPCNTGVDCSIAGNRTCDTASPGGICTVFGCEPGTCPDNAVCVRWRPMESRLSFTACMARCESDGECRVDEGYRCLADEDLAGLAENLEEDLPRYCVATVPDE